MSDQGLTEEPANVRDSWDLLETPRTSHSETDEPAISQPVVSIRRVKARTSEHSYEKVTAKKHSKGQKLYTETDKYKYGYDDANRIKSKARQKRPTSAHSGRIITNTSFCPGLLTSSRPVSAKSFSDPPKVVPKRYRKLGLRSHDDMLREQIEQLRLLLDDTENMSKEELNRQHVEQTANMIAVDSKGRPLHSYYEDYKAVNGGRRSRGIIISRSLPESLRPKSPLSSSTSSFASSQGSQRYGSISSSRSPSPDRRSNKRVSFKGSASKTSSNRRPLTISVSSVKSQSSQSTTNLSYKENRLWYEDLPSEGYNRQSVSSSASHSSSCSSEGDEIERVSDFNRRPQSSNSIHSLRSSKTSTKYQYLSEVGKSQKSAYRQKSSAISHRDNTVDLPELESHADQIKYGTYEDIDGHKHSDSNLRRTMNPDVKQWLKEKEKAIREMKQKQKKQEKRKQVAEEKEKQKKEERQAESAKHLREWQASKRKEAKLLRRQNLAKRKIEKQIKSGSEADLSFAKGVKTETSGQKKSAELKPTAPTKPRPMSAPASRRKVVKSQVPLAQVIKNSPDLQERLKVLEKQKKLKHRQSYDEWVKIKEKEKKDVMKVVREQRKKLEQEISEETAKVISEAAKRRSENIRFKGSAATQAEKSPKEKEATPDINQSPQSSYTWRREEEQPKAKPPHPRVSKHTPVRSIPVSAPSAPKSTKQRPRKPNVEEKIPDTPANPFSDPFKSPKLSRPKSKLEQSGVNGPEFSRFIWELVNEQENGANRPEPQGADSPEKSPEASASKEKDELKTPPKPTHSSSPTPPDSDKASPDNNTTANQVGEPVIESGRSIFAMTSIE